jgi:predicted transcriptional regulator of viral defense system
MDERDRVSGKYVRFRGQPSLEAALAALGSSQHVVFSLPQILELGLGAAAVQKRAALGRIHRVYRGVYSLVPPELLSREGRFMAAVLACGEGAVLSHRSAAMLHGLLWSERAKIDVTIPRRSGLKHRGIDLHRSTTLTPADTTQVNNIPCTTVARTQLDIADVLNQRSVERAFDQADVLEVFDLRALEDQLARNATRPGAALIRTVLAEHYIGSTPTWSEFEERFVGVCRSTGVPAPDVNVWITLDDGERPIRADFVWWEQRIAIETDGHKTHRTPQAFERDRRNDQRLTLARWRPVRVTWRQLWCRRHQVERLLLQLFPA